MFFVVNFSHLGVYTCLLSLLYFNALMLSFSILTYTYQMVKTEVETNLLPLFSHGRIWRKTATVVDPGIVPVSLQCVHTTHPPATHTFHLSNCASHRLPNTNENSCACCFAQHIIPSCVQCHLLFSTKEVAFDGQKAKQLSSRVELTEVSDLPLIYCLTIGKLLNFTETLFPYL